MKKIGEWSCQRPGCNTTFKEEIKTYDPPEHGKRHRLTNPVFCPRCGTSQRIKEAINLKMEE